MNFVEHRKWATAAVFVLLTCTALAQKGPPAQPVLIQADIERGDAGQTRLFIEVVRPLPGYYALEKAVQEKTLSGGYQDDIEARRKDVTYMPPSKLALTQAEFEADPNQSQATGPFVEIQIRRRELVRHIKTWQVEKDRFLSGRVQEKERIPLFSMWSWEPELVVGAGEICLVSAVELKQRRGALSVFVGVTDRDGRLRLPLLYFLRSYLAQPEPEGAELRFELPNKNVRLSCVLPAAVLEKMATDYAIKP